MTLELRRAQQVGRDQVEKESISENKNSICRNPLQFSIRQRQSPSEGGWQFGRGGGDSSDE